MTPDDPNSTVLSDPSSQPPFSLLFFCLLSTPSLSLLPCPCVFRTHWLRAHPHPPTHTLQAYVRIHCYPYYGKMHPRASPMESGTESYGSKGASASPSNGPFPLCKFCNHGTSLIHPSPLACIRALLASIRIPTARIRGFLSVSIPHRVYIALSAIIGIRRESRCNLDFNAREISMSGGVPFPILISRWAVLLFCSPCAVPSACKPRLG